MYRAHGDQLFLFGVCIPLRNFRIFCRFFELASERGSVGAKIEWGRGLKELLGWGRSNVSWVDEDSDLNLPGPEGSPGGVFKKGIEMPAGILIPE